MADDTPSSAEQPAARPTSPLLSGVIGALVTGVLGVTVGGGYAWYAERTAGNERVAQVEAKVEACTDQQQSLELQLRDAKQDAAILRVRVELARTLDELAKRNYGNASDHLALAKQHYDVIVPSPSLEVGEALTGMEIREGGRLKVQLDDVMKLSRQVDALLTDA